jgi:hypothetical protein
LACLHLEAERVVILGAAALAERRLRSLARV